MPAPSPRISNETICDILRRNILRWGPDILHRATFGTNRVKRLLGVTLAAHPDSSPTLAMSVNAGFPLGLLRFRLGLAGGDALFLAVVRQLRRHGVQPASWRAGSEADLARSLPPGWLLLLLLYYSRYMSYIGPETLS